MKYQLEYYFLFVSVAIKTPSVSILTNCRLRNTFWKASIIDEKEIVAF